MFCPVSKKVIYQTDELALEALIQHHIRNFHQQGRGPKNIYLCDHCGLWHFTSKGEPHPELESSDVKERIKKEQLGEYWERRLR